MYYACGCSLEWKGLAGVRRGRYTLYVRLFMPCILKCLFCKVLILFVLNIINQSSPDWEIPNGNRYVVACWNGKGAQSSGVRRGRYTLYVRLFMPCIFKMSQKSFNTFCVKDHQLVKSRLGNSQWEQVYGCLLEWKGRAGPRGQKRHLHAIVFTLCIYTYMAQD